MPSGKPERKGVYELLFIYAGTGTGQEPRPASPHCYELGTKKPLLNEELKDGVKLVALYKLLAPVHLLKEAFIIEQQEENSSPKCYENIQGLRNCF